MNIRELFLTDGRGALLSAFLLGVVLVRFEALFGIPIKVLYLLAIIPVFFAIYDFICYSIKSKNSALLLKIIAWANLSYCVLSLSLAWYHREEITFWGWGYLFAEVFIVVTLASIELNKAKSNS